MIKDYLKFAIGNISHSRLRSWLTMLGIFIGIAAVVSLISLGQGLQNAITNEFQKLGADRITIQPGGAIAGPVSGGLTAAKLYEHDVDVVRRISDVEFATGATSDSARVQFKEETKLAYVFGFDTDSKTTSYIEGTGAYDVEFGRNPNGGYEAVVGYKIANDMFKKKISAGDKITINSQDFKVVGVQKEAGNGVSDVLIRAPKDTARSMFNKTTEVSMILVKTKPGTIPSKVAEEINEKLRRDHGLKKGKEDFTVQTSESLIKTFTTIFGIVQAVLVGIAAISLLVGGVGIMNTMYTAVFQRTKEIGIMKAIGAENKDIMLLFLIESGMLGLVGGIIGVILGLGLSKAVELVASKGFGIAVLKADMSPILIIGALAFSFGVGAISGVLPAIQASRQKPVESLRYE